MSFCELFSGVVYVLMLVVADLVLTAHCGSGGREASDEDKAASISIGV